MPAEASTLAIDIGGTKIRAALVSGTSLGEAVTLPTRPEGGESVLDRVIRAASGFEGYDAIGVASAGVIRDGRVTHATDLIPGWAGTDIAGGLGERFGVPVAVLGDVHAHGLGEARYGAGRGLGSLLAVGVGTGIGGAMVVDGVPMVGHHGFAGHVGHIQHPSCVGLRCSCGREGHIEALASGSGLEAEYRRRTFAECSGREIAERAASGEDAAVTVLTRAGEALGEALGSLVNVLDPEAVVLSGSVVAAGEIWWDALRRGYLGSALDAAAGTPLLTGELGDAAPLLGAAAYAKGNL